jgi:uncharacterized protein
MRKVELSLVTARRLAITKQHLSGTRPANPNKETIISLLKDMRYLQLDPTTAVLPSHLIVLWSRLGPFRESHLDELAWKDKKIFEYWARAASLVLTEDYPLYLPRMRQFRAWGYPNEDGVWAKRMKWWIGQNSGLRSAIVTELKRRGPLTTRDFGPDLEKSGKVNPTEAYRKWGLRMSDWGSARSVPPMLDSMYHEGMIMVAGRRGRQKVWDLTERFLPDWTPKKELTSDQVEYVAAQHALGAMGVATPKQIEFHFLRWRHPRIERTMDALVAESKVLPVSLTDEKKGSTWFIRSEDLRLAERIEDGLWEPRTTLLSPFDNLINDRDRTLALFEFFFRIEIYTPKSKRTHGYFVLPILDGDRLVGRVDPTMDRKKERLLVNAVYAERGAPEDPATARRIADAISGLAHFAGAKEVVYSRRVPGPWRKYLK